MDDNGSLKRADDLQRRIMWWLLGIVAAGLMTVAGGFYSWSVAVREGMASVEILATKVVDLERETNRHREQPWHAEAGHLIRLQEAQAVQMREQLDRIELKQDRIELKLGRQE